MRQFYRAAAGYTDTNDGQFPRVPDGQPAAAAGETLKQAGYLSADVRFTCPSAPPDATAPVALATYAYTLGFRDEAGRLHGLDRGPGNDLLPILADAPARPDGTASRSTTGTARTSCSPAATSGSARSHCRRRTETTSSATRAGWWPRGCSSRTRPWGGRERP